jgi:hypothetical protein
MRDGDYLFRDYGLRNGPSPTSPVEPDSFLVVTGPDFILRKRIPLQLSRLELILHVSPSRKYLVDVEDRQCEIEYACPRSPAGTRWLGCLHHAAPRG